MSAREKLNSASVCGCLVIAAMLGILLQSWWVFWIAAVALIAAELQNCMPAQFEPAAVASPAGVAE